MMRILVSGGGGQVGSALSQVGSDRGLDLTALGRDDLNISDAASIAKAFKALKPEILINAAAYTAVDKAQLEPDVAYSVNQKGSALLAEACSQVGIPILHISTDYVFDGLKGGSYSEMDSVNPLNVYAKSKEAGELAVRCGIQRHIILRTSWVFGVAGDNFVKKVVRLARVRDDLQVVADQFGGPTSARSIAEALLMIVARYKESGRVPWGTYHYCQQPYVSRHQFAQTIIMRAVKMGLIDHEVKVLPVSTSDSQPSVVRPQNSMLDRSKIMSTFDLDSTSWLSHIDEVIRAAI